MKHNLRNIRTMSHLSGKYIVMIELIAFTQLLDLNHNTGERQSQHAEDEFYRRVGQSWLERLAARLLCVPAIGKGRDLRGPSACSGDERLIRQRSACGCGLPQKTPRS